MYPTSEALDEIMWKHILLTTNNIEPLYVSDGVPHDMKHSRWKEWEDKKITASQDFLCSSTKPNMVTNRSKNHVRNCLAHQNIWENSFLGVHLSPVQIVWHKGVCGEFLGVRIVHTIFQTFLLYCTTKLLWPKFWGEQFLLRTKFWWTKIFTIILVLTALSTKFGDFIFFLYNPAHSGT